MPTVNVADLTPILIVVADGQWDCLSPTTNFRAIRLLITLNLMGGVNESVPEGRYDFNVLDLPDGTTIASLTPHIDL